MCSAAPIASPSSPAAGWIHVCRNGVREKSFPLATLFKAHPPAIARFLKAQVGDKDAAIILRTTVSEPQVRFFEHIMTRLANQGSGSFSSGRREADTGAKLTQEQYDKLSYSQKKDYAERSAQGGR